MKFKTGKGNLIEVHDKPFAKGGQAGIYKVITPKISYLIAKIFSTNSFINKATGILDLKKVTKLKNRLEFMVNNNPFINSQQKIQEAFAWPTDLLFDVNNNFAGFLLPYFDNSIELIKILSGKKLPLKWDRFEIQHSDSYNSRLKVCYNISQAIAEIHSSGKYTIIDLKAENIMLKNNGFVSMIDLDSIQISNNNTVLFHAEVHTPDFSPPEFHKNLLNYKKDFVDETWDRFSFGVLAYLLLFKIHPFAGMTHLKKSNIHTMDDFIINGLFAHGNQKSDLDLAKPHLNYDILLSDDLKNLFYKCFVEGHKDPRKRPSIVHWRDAFLKEISKNRFRKISGAINQPSPYISLLNPIIKTPANNAVPLPFVNHFTVTPAGVNLAYLNWNISNAATIEINNKPVAAIGNMQIKLTNQAYILKAYNSIGKVISKQVSANFNVKINSFSHTIIQNKIDFKWSVSNAKTVAIDNIPVANSGSKTISLGVGSHTIVATDVNGFSVSQQLLINVLTSIDKFDLNLFRSNAELNWDVVNAKEVRLDKVIVSSKGTKSVSLNPQTYTLTAVDINGKVLAKNVNVNVSPFIKKFDIIQNNGIIEVFWDVFYAKECLLNGDKIPLVGSKKYFVSPKKIKLEIFDFKGQSVIRCNTINAIINSNIIEVSSSNSNTSVNSNGGNIKVRIQGGNNLIISNTGNIKINSAGNKIHIKNNKGEIDINI
ncbi:MAG: hypothetical protein HXX09_13220 [Bacteroidetes bacterium]|nr:hypothetical protein [Bacteroidota bacterium]